MNPYTAASQIAEMARKLPQYLQENGMEIRVLMPRYGSINERRHRLHEVVRLSGMNIIVQDDDFPLIIKVASLPGARMQVYFLDNEDFFKRKSLFTDERGTPFEDNADRMVFFCKGVLETVKKFGWAPDVVHCHGWMTSLIPLYVKSAYQNEPLFQHSKVVFSLYDAGLEIDFPGTFIDKASINNLSVEDLKVYQNEAGTTLEQGAVEHVDALISGSEEMNDRAQELVGNKDIPVLAYEEGDAYLKNCLHLYQSLLAEVEHEGK